MVERPWVLVEESVVKRSVGHEDNYVPGTSIPPTARIKLQGRSLLYDPLLQ